MSAPALRALILCSHERFGRLLENELLRMGLAPTWPRRSLPTRACTPSCWLIPNPCLCPTVALCPPFSWEELPTIPLAEMATCTCAAPLLCRRWKTPYGG